MPLVYERPSADGALRQGEILAEIWEHRARAIIEDTDESPVEFDQRLYSHVVILTADCDLEWDFRARFDQLDGGFQAIASDFDESHGSFVPYVLTCELYARDRIRDRPNINTDIWKRIKRNQDERYHRIEPARIAGHDPEELPEFIADFKKVLPLPTGSLYRSISSGHVRRIGIVPPVYVHDLMHRFYGFQSRVGLSDS